MHRRKTAKTILTVLAATAAVAGIWLLYTHDPSAKGSLFMPCVSKLVTGYDCPGCGTTRAMHCLLHGDMAGVWHFNRSLFFYLPMCALIFCARFTPRGSLMRRAFESPVLAVVLLAFTIGWTIWRNIYIPL